MKEGEREGGGRVFMLDCKDGRHGSHEKGDYVACLAVWTDGVGGWYKEEINQWKEIYNSLG